MLKCTHVCGQQFFAGWNWRKGNEIERKGSENKSWINFSQQKQKFESCKVFKYTGKIFKWIISFYDHIIKFRNRSGNLTLYPEVCFHLMNQELFPSTTMIKMLTTIECSKKKVKMSLATLGLLIAYRSFKVKHIFEMVFHVNQHFEAGKWDWRVGKLKCLHTQHQKLYVDKDFLYWFLNCEIITKTWQFQLKYLSEHDKHFLSFPQN